jgi:alginate O-acetyltransferase complex protein AlgI
MVAVLVGWVFFYFESLSRAAAFMQTMFGLNSAPITSGELLIQLENHMLLLAFAIIAATPLPVRIHRLLSERMKPRIARQLYVNALLPAACLGILGGSALLLVGKTYAPFFYFRF